MHINQNQLAGFEWMQFLTSTGKTPVPVDNTRLKNQILNTITGRVDWKIYTIGAIAIVGLIWAFKK